MWINGLIDLKFKIIKFLREDIVVNFYEKDV